MLKSLSNVGHPSGAMLTVVLPCGPPKNAGFAVQGSAAMVVVTSPCTEPTSKYPSAPVSFMPPICPVRPSWPPRSEASLAVPRSDSAC